MIYTIRKFDEGINDKNLFKAVFLAGGSGSGKSFVVKKAFGLGIGDISSLGVKIVNSDFFFEKGLHKLGLPFEIDVNNIEVYAKQMSLRAWARDLADNRQTMYINGMLPIIIDGTGRDYAKIEQQAKVLESIGYDISMLFVNTSLEVALKRNAERKRKVDPSIAEDAWHNVQKNIGHFQSFFKKFDVIDNSKYYPVGSPEANNFADHVYKIGKKHIEAPLENFKGKQILAKLRSTGGKYLSDLVED